MRRSRTTLADRSRRDADRERPGDGDTQRPLRVASAAVRARAALTAAFFLSGTAGLVFEIVWLYRAGLVFGNTTWSTSIVLSSLMGGLAGGNWLAARCGHRLTHLVRSYAACELVVATSGLVVTYVLGDLTRVVGQATSAFVDAFWIVNGVRLVTALLVLAWPAIAMGATLPILVALFCRWRPGVGRAVGRLYGWNTLGAVAGVLAAELLLIPRAGVTGSAWAAALLDMTAACLALWTLGTHGEPPAAVPPDVVNAGPRPWRLLACAFVSGATLMALEVVWFRFLSMLVANTTLAMSLMLATVLAGLGIGGIAASAWLARRPGAATHLHAVAFAAAGTVIASYWTFQFVTDGSRALGWQRILGFVAWMTVPNAVLSAVIFTLLGERLKTAAVFDSRAAGWLALANTSGAMTGPAVAGFALLPVLGMERSLFVLALAYLVIGLLTNRGAHTSAWHRARSLLVAVAAIAVVTIVFPFGLMSRVYFGRATSAYARDGSRLVAVREGSGETIFLMHHAAEGEPSYVRLVTNGISMSATTAKAKRYMRYFVYLPMLLHPSPLKQVLVICYGLGVTAGAATDIAGVSSIDVAEISPDILAISDLINGVGGGPLHDPRVRLHIEDGRYFLESTPRRFDLITAEPPPPGAPGAVTLYTRDYFRLIQSHLADGGMVTYWLPVARVSGTHHAAIIKAFCDVFEDCSLWNATPSDLMLLGSRQARGPSTAFTWAWTDRVLRAHLEEDGFERPEQIGATFVGDASYLAGLTEGAAPVTDDYPRRIAVAAGTPLSDRRRALDASRSAAYREAIDPSRTRARFAASPLIARMWPIDLRARTLLFFDTEWGINGVLGVDHGGHRGQTQGAAP